MLIVALGKRLYAHIMLKASRCLILSNGLYRICISYSACRVFAIRVCQLRADNAMKTVLKCAGFYRAHSEIGAYAF